MSTTSRKVGARLSKRKPDLRGLQAALKEGFNRKAQPATLRVAMRAGLEGLEELAFTLESPCY